MPHLSPGASLLTASLVLFFSSHSPPPSTTALVYSSRSLPILFRSQLQMRHPPYRSSASKISLLYSAHNVQGRDHPQRHLTACRHRPTMGRPAAAAGGMRYTVTDTLPKLVMQYFKVSEQWRSDNTLSQSQQMTWQ